jgi:hypothetical protein
VQRIVGVGAEIGAGRRSRQGPSVNLSGKPRILTSPWPGWSALISISWLAIGGPLIAPCRRIGSPMPLAGASGRRCPSPAYRVADARS